MKLGKSFQTCCVPDNVPDIGYDRIPAIDSLSITIDGVAKQLSLLKTNKASGPDAIPPWFLKEYAAEIAPKGYPN